jgi:hypothetical protein
MDQAVIIIMIIVLADLKFAVVTLAAVKPALDRSMATGQAVGSKILDHLGQHGQISS